MLYLVPTPIGNTEDVTLRALRLFRELKYFICEDTRTTKKLFQLLEIKYKGESRNTSDDAETGKDFFSLTSFTDAGKLKHYINLIRANDVVLVSDAGTPGLSDPGKKMIELCNEHKLPYSVLPGANALVPAVVSAGFDTSKFVYLGFLPQKKGRQTLLQNIVASLNPSASSSLGSSLAKGAFSGYPVFFYESVHRIEKLFKQLKEFGFEGKVCLCREISKLHEQIVNGDLDEVLALLQSGEIKVKGEFVVGLSVK